MHNLEFARASNTGKLLLLPHPHPLDPSVTFPPSSPFSDPLLPTSPLPAPFPLLLIAGVPSHDAQLQELCTADPTGSNTLVLFPSTDSIDLSTWLSSRSAVPPSPPLPPQSPLP